MSKPDYSALDDAGLNLHAVFAIDRLPAELRNALDPENEYKQLILIGNGGRKLWATLQAEGFTSANPVDDISVCRVETWFAGQAAGVRHKVIYPGERQIGLQSLGELAGWHFASPFMVGINAQWGSWFAYRVALLADTDFELTPPEAGVSPCASCLEKPCIDVCPGHAMTDGRFDLQSCVGYRKQSDSACRATCLARLACPVGSEHRYSGEQIRHHYTASIKIIERYY